MKAQIAWLREMVDLEGITEKDIIERMTMTGTNIEGVESVCDENQGVIIAKILRIRSHPNADKLVVCDVDTGDKTVQVVTGAPNVQEGAKVLLALPGAKLTGGIEIQATEFRGVHSEGMLCSFEELGYSKGVIPREYTDGIVLLPEDAPLGQEFLEAYGLCEGVLEAEITFNRPDCLSMFGLAKEFSATFEREAHLLPHADFSVFPKGDVKVEIDEEICPAYMALEFEGVETTPSPFSWQLRLMDMGVRPINLLVDATNLTMLYSGSPTHAFDQDTLGPEGIKVRAAIDGEVSETLDGVERELREGDILITNGEHIIAIGGIMGGKDTQITDQTKRVLVEFATFDKKQIRQTSKRLGLRTEASSRFEKGVESQRIALAISVFMHLMEGRYTSVKLSGILKKTERDPVFMRYARVPVLLGITLSPEEIKRLFDRIECRYEEETRGDEKGLLVYPPSYRSDIQIEADLLEEIARLYGFDNIPSTLPVLNKPAMQYDATLKEWKLRELLWAMGTDEILGYSFVSPNSVKRLGLDDQEPLMLLNPLGEEFSQMRPSLLVTALECLLSNQKKGAQDQAIYEIGNVFHREGEQMMQEKKLSIGMLNAGDFYVLKGMLETILDAFGAKGTFVPGTSPFYHPVRSADVVVDGEILGSFGVLHPKLASAWELDGEVVLAEIHLEHLFTRELPETVFVPPSRFPTATRDIAILVDEKVTHEQIVNVMQEEGVPLLTKVELFDTFTHPSWEGQKSMAYHMTFGSDQRTLNTEEVEEIYDRIYTGLQRQLQAQRR